MTTMSLSTAVASLQPGVSTSKDVALEAWGLLNGFCYTINPFLENNRRFIDITCGLVFISIILMFVRARIPTVNSNDHPHSKWDYLKAGFSSLCLAAMAYKTAALQHEYHTRRDFFLETVTKAVINLQPWKTTSSDLASKSWVIVKGTIDGSSFGIASLRNEFLGMTLGLFTTLLATGSAIHSQRQTQEQSLSAQVCDTITMLSLALATLVSVCGYAYASRFSVK